MRHVLALTLLALVLLPGTAGAAPAQSLLHHGIRVSGSLSIDAVTDVQDQQLGPNGPCLGTERVALTYEGSLRGSAREFVRYISHGPCTTTTPVRSDLFIDGVLTGQVASRSGTLNYRARFVFPAAGGGYGTLVITRGYGGLDGVRGVVQLTFDPASGRVNYSGMVWFAH